MGIKLFCKVLSHAKRQMVIKKVKMLLIIATVYKGNYKDFFFSEQKRQEKGIDFTWLRQG